MGLQQSIRFHAETDVGLKRDHNEDNFLVDKKLALFIVADGMGGHAGGAIASRMAVDILHQEVRKVRKPAAQLPPSPNHSQDGERREDSTEDVNEEERCRTALLRGFATSNREIYIKGMTEQELAGMGTTLSAMLILDDLALFGHVGDSRVYLIRDDKIVQLSEDHSLVYEHVKAGLITPEQARESFFRNIITRSIGTESTIVVDSFSIDIRKDDIFLLCTDGLTTMIDEEEIYDTIMENRLSETPEKLIDLANEKGGEDNITVITVHIGIDPTTKLTRKKKRKPKKKKPLSRRDVY
ncbi:MAG: protein-serine/threonine phosphatase PrpC [Myxococcota bacterium]